MTAAIDHVLALWVDAELRGDATALDALLTNDFVGIGPMGFMLPKSAWLARFAHGLHYEALRLDEVSTRTYGDTMLVVARQHAQGDRRGNPTPPDLRLSITVVGEGDEWRIAGIQHSFMEGTPGARP